MKKIFALFFVMFMLVSSVFAQSNLDLQLEVRFANLERIARTLEVSMDALISYVSQINGDASKLNDFKSQFLSAKSDFNSAKTHAQLDAKMQAASVIIGSFWQEYTKQFDANKGNGFAALKALADALKSAKPELDSLTEKYWDTRIANVLQIYDNDVAAAEKLLPLLKNHPNYTKIVEKLDEIKAERPNLESALKSKNEVSIINIQTKLGFLAQDLGNLVAGKG